MPVTAEVWVTDGATGQGKMLLKYGLDDKGVAVPIVNNAPALATDLEDDGVETDEIPSRVLFPENGEDFIRHLPDELHGGYVKVNVLEVK